MSYRPPSDPLARPKKDQEQPGQNGDLFDRSGGKRSAATKDNSYTARDIEVRRVWSLSASAPPCMSAAPTSGPSNI